MKLQSKLLQSDSKLQCAYCQGTGKDRFGVMSALSSCPACQGRGYHWMTPPVVACAYCAHTGVSPTGTRNPCLACGGKGVHQRSPDAPLCENCGGTGRSRSGHFYCHPCHGSGRKLSYP
ncbi:hypothetical protein [Phormidium sp. CCY1219]|uniref:hypothetical protein n=1 Tax=Phormidium sp. CCY1219 TaxID=2886104 RepID=UPI002D1ED1C6|nr:hypothetical protein [Phormidium sp. CCY1219]MEB3831534.1 hypothetical protein [Phormidium sp. CCY1219]